MDDGPFDPNKGENITIKPNEAMMGVAKEIADALKDPEKALTAILDGYMTLSALSKKDISNSMKDEILDQCLINMRWVNKYNKIFDSAWNDHKKANDCSPNKTEFDAEVKRRCEEEGIEAGLLKILMTQNRSNTEYELDHVDIAVEILSQKKEYSRIFSLVEKCVDTAEKRGIGSRVYYLRKAADILDSIKELKDDYNGDVLTERMIGLAKKSRYISLHIELLKNSGKIDELIAEGRRIFDKTSNDSLQPHELSNGYSSAIEYLSAAGEEGTEKMTELAASNCDFMDEIRRLSRVYHSKAETKTGKEKQEIFSKARGYDLVLRYSHKGKSG
ncbi:hypothetical protein COV19_00525 [Candidatus Woesearchaeota archaeon CG10_big_fil_rev_8_21_14_0_10_44_13]|nr:MAG: hypothetical protein COV19_00525 [Candidatus Woesearchaeota archaeon CG10_big_fil_rev_8_21_14_0_10_44_13]